MNQINQTGHVAVASEPESLEYMLRADLQRGDTIIATTRPILRHLLANGDQSLFSDELIARVRGMMGHLARQLLMAQAAAENAQDPAVYADERQAELAQKLFEDSAFLAHAHALTIEAQIAEQLQRRSGIDAVLSPLLQELAASTSEQTAALSMRVLAQQARFAQQMRRMELPLGELPGDLFHKALLLLRNQDGEPAGAEQAESQLRADYNEAESRLGLITRMIMEMGNKAPRALAIDHAGMAIFCTALAMASRQDRNLAILSFGENQLARLALSLRAAGLKQSAVEEQFLYIHPDVVLPAGFATLPGDRAAQLLASSQAEAAA